MKHTYTITEEGKKTENQRRRLHCLINVFHSFLFVFFYLSFLLPHIHINTLFVSVCIYVYSRSGFLSFLSLLAVILTPPFFSLLLLSSIVGCGSIQKM